MPLCVFVRVVECVRAREYVYFLPKEGKGRKAHLPYQSKADYAQKEKKGNVWKIWFETILETFKVKYCIIGVLYYYNI